QEFENINNVINRLATAIEESKELAIKKGVFRKEKQREYVSKVKNFKYRVGGPMRYESLNSAKIVSKWKVEYDRLNEISLIKERFDETCKIIHESTTFDEKSLLNLLDIFVWKIAKSVLNPDSESKEELIPSLIKEITKQPLHWKYQVWLNGIWVQGKLVQMKDGLTFRRPTVTDLKELQKYLRWETRSSSGTCILEFSADEDKKSQVENRVHKIIQLIRLYGICCVYDKNTILQSDSINEEESVRIGSGNPYYENYFLVISQRNSHSLEQFLNFMNNLLPEEAYVPNSKESNHLVIAIRRFNDALLKNEQLQIKIALSVMCLEALYGDNKSELSFRFKNRISKAMGILGCDAKKVYEILDKAYEIRSDYVHGDKFESRDVESVDLRSILDYARISILLFLQLNNLGHDKKKFLAILDDALYDKEQDIELRKLLKKCKFLKTSSKQFQKH
ncbi:MAG: hypothetical protein DA330_04480, partial [Nitrososphaera sp.]|nr:hypothetical protein [Nitrososphaera sp.]